MTNPRWGTGTYKSDSTCRSSQGPIRPLKSLGVHFKFLTNVTVFPDPALGPERCPNYFSSRYTESSVSPAPLQLEGIYTLPQCVGFPTNNCIFRINLLVENTPSETSFWALSLPHTRGSAFLHVSDLRKDQGRGAHYRHHLRGHSDARDSLLLELNTGHVLADV